MPAQAAAPPPLRELVADYLRTRRALGYKLDGTERVLSAFADYLEVPSLRPGW